MSISDRIKEARESLNLTQAELAQKLDVTKSAISNYETGTSSPKEPVLFKMFEVFNCDANFLFQDEFSHISKVHDEIKNKKTSSDEDISSEDQAFALKLYKWLVEQGYMNYGEDITREQLEFLDGLHKIILSFFDKRKE